MERRERRKFTDEFKRGTVRLCKQRDRSIGEVAKELDLTESALRCRVAPPICFADLGVM